MCFFSGEITLREALNTLSERSEGLVIPKPPPSLAGNAISSLSESFGGG